MDNQIIKLQKNANYFNNRSANLSNAAPQQGQVKSSGAAPTEPQIPKGKKINIRRGQQEVANQ